MDPSSWLIGQSQVNNHIKNVFSKFKLMDSIANISTKSQSYIYNSIYLVPPMHPPHDETQMEIGWLQPDLTNRHPQLGKHQVLLAYNTKFASTQPQESQQIEWNYKIANGFKSKLIIKLLSCFHQVLLHPTHTLLCWQIYQKPTIMVFF